MAPAPAGDAGQTGETAIVCPGASDPMLLLFFGMPWMVPALIGGAAAVLVRGALRRTRAAGARRASRMRT